MTSFWLVSVLVWVFISCALETSGLFDSFCFLLEDLSGLSLSPPLSRFVRPLLWSSKACISDESVNPGEIPPIPALLDSAEWITVAALFILCRRQGRIEEDLGDRVEGSRIVVDCKALVP